MRLHEIQTQVHVSKDKRNDFGKYNYRTAEGILAAIKGALQEGESIVVSDEMQELAGQIFVSATATLTFKDGKTAFAKGHAMHPLTKKGMDPSQITGAASSYARKYALSGLVAIDDGSVDPDAAKEPYSASMDAPQANQKSGGINDAWKDNVMDGLPKDPTPRQTAEAFAKAICEGFVGKGIKALENEWGRRSKIIETLEDKYKDLHEKVVDAYEIEMMKITDASRQ